MRYNECLNGMAWFTITVLSLLVSPYENFADNKHVGDKRSFPGRRISVDGHGILEVLRTNDRKRPIFAGGGQDWHLVFKGDKWLILSSAGEVGQKELFLSFTLEKVLDANSELVALKEEPDDSCFWNLELEEKKPLVSTRWCYARPTAGALRGWFLAVGDPIEVKNDYVVSRAVTLQKEKSAKARLRLWIDGK